MQKNWLSYDEQLDLLARRGMRIEDESAAAQVLSCVSYYRLSGYFRYWQKDPDYGDDEGYRRKRGALDGVSWV